MTTHTWDQQFRAMVSSGIFPSIINRVLFAGYYRSGKTKLPQDIFGRDNIEDITLHRQLIVDDLIGSYGPKEAGGFEWKDGPMARAMRYGKPLVINEIDQMSPDVRCALHAALDDPPAYTLPSGERLIAAKGYCVIATSNSDPTTLPPGVFDRFDVIMKVDRLSQGLRSALGTLADRAEAVAGRGVDWVARWSRPASVNLFLAAAKLRQHGMNDEAIATTLGLDGMAATDFLTAISDR